MHRLIPALNSPAITKNKNASQWKQCKLNQYRYAVATYIATTISYITSYVMVVAISYVLILTDYTAYIATSILTSYLCVI